MGRRSISHKDDFEPGPARRLPGQIPTHNPNMRRNRQIKNFFVITLLSLGTPMILMGDEVRRTQQGNNNAYCQDNEISWFDWSLLETHAELHRFVKRMIYYRLQGDSSDELSLNQVLSQARIQWHGVNLNKPDWSDHSHSLAFTARIRRDSMMIHVMINAYREPLEFELPPVSGDTGDRWHLLVDTSRSDGEDIYEWGKDPPVITQKYLLLPYSTVMVIYRVPQH